MSSQNRKRILSGINPSSSRGLHLGNYLGAVKRFIPLQDQGEAYFFVADLHSLNTIFSPQEVKSNTDNVFLEYLAFGINPEKSVFYVESDIPEITYLQTILNNCVTISELSRMHGYKDKLSKEVQLTQINAGLFEYPVLMAADILLFQADIVPVGDDQTQHVEICREIAKTFNNRYGNILKIPALSIEKSTGKIPGINGEKKMSKSLGNDLPVFAPESEIQKQIRSITTDPARIRPTDPGNPGKNVCFLYLKMLDFDQKRLLELEDRYRRGTIGDVEIKNLLLEIFLAYFKPYRDKKQQLLFDPKYVSQVRREGQAKAQSIAQENLYKIKKAIGLN